LEDLWEDRPDDARIALKEAVPTLIDMLRTNDFELRFAAAQAVWRIGGRPDLVIPVFEQGLMDSDYVIKAARLLGAVGPEARNSVPQLIDALGRQRLDFVREELVAALAAIDPTVKV
jgi:HEAT repeat protein